MLQTNIHQFCLLIIDNPASLTSRVPCFTNIFTAEAADGKLVKFGEPHLVAGKSQRNGLGEDHTIEDMVPTSCRVRAFASKWLV